jgi:hypothetical protein
MKEALAKQSIEAPCSAAGPFASSLDMDGFSISLIADLHGLSFLGISGSRRRTQPRPVILSQAGRDDLLDRVATVDDQIGPGYHVGGIAG